MRLYQWYPFCVGQHQSVWDAVSRFAAGSRRHQHGTDIRDKALLAHLSFLHLSNVCGVVGINLSRRLAKQ